MPADAHLLGARLVLAEKDMESNYLTFKAIIVVQGHKDKDNSSLVHKSTNMCQPSMKLQTVVAAIFGFHFWSTDVSQTSLKSGIPLLRDVSIRRTGEFQLPLGTLLKLLPHCMFFRTLMIIGIPSSRTTCIVI